MIKHNRSETQSVDPGLVRCRWLRQAPLIANRDVVGPWEKFQVINNGDGSISLRANANGKFVTAENGGGSPLIATATRSAAPGKPSAS